MGGLRGAPPQTVLLTMQASYRVLFSNICYARDINGCLTHHLLYAHRHIYCSPAVQEKALQQVKKLIEREDPDLCCFVEIDKGSFPSSNFNQLEKLMNEKYTHFDIENKYAKESPLRSFAITKGKSNAFLAKEALSFQKIYFTRGTKRLIYKLQLAGDITLFFAHFSLKKIVRESQLQQVKRLMQEVRGEAIFLGDFNIMTGLEEIAPLLHSNFVLVNREDKHTFTFHKRTMLLDLCICTRALAARLDLQVIPQPYSDHAALLLDIHEAS
jgi:endonuclease/exonuclease/phosphatase family metal-dependent hydrolase